MDPIYCKNEKYLASNMEACAQIQYWYVYILLMSHFYVLTITKDYFYMNCIAVICKK